MSHSKILMRPIDFPRGWCQSDRELGATGLKSNTESDDRMGKMFCWATTDKAEDIAYSFETKPTFSEAQNGISQEAV